MKQQIMSIGGTYGARAPCPASASRTAPLQTSNHQHCTPKKQRKFQTQHELHRSTQQATAHADPPSDEAIDHDDEVLREPTALRHVLLGLGAPHVLPAPACRLLLHLQPLPLRLLHRPRRRCGRQRRRPEAAHPAPATTAAALRRRGGAER
jgi:hypothetical protein